MTKHIFCQRVVCVALVLLCSTQAFGQAYKAAIGYNRLQSEVGAGLANGTGVVVGMAEANTGAVGSNTYFLNTADAQFLGKFFTDNSNLTPRNTSGHATAVGQLFFGNASSMSSGVTNVQVYDAENFVITQQQLGNAGVNPNATAGFSVMNHSYVGNGLPPAIAVESNSRMDYTVARDNFTNVVALNNPGNPLPQLYGQSYNSIVVGLSNGTHSPGPTTLGVVGRVKPDIVSPMGTTSEATPVVSSTAALLHQAASNFGTPNARNSEAMKAIIMAGATKDTLPTWSNTSTRPLDSVFGAGQVNVYNSYRILEAGETNGEINIPITSTAVNSGLKGWDFGTSITPGSPLHWNFNVAEGFSISEASILLTWNAQFKDALGNFTSSLSLANMDLRLFRSNNGVLGPQVAASLSTIDNVEHIYLRNLTAGGYTIQVTSNLDTSFGLAWNITAVPEPGSFACLFVVGLAVSIHTVRTKRRRSSKQAAKA